MATKRVNIDIVARDRSQRALQGVRGSLDRVKKSVFNVRNALAGLGAGLVIRNLVNTGKEIESLQVRLKFLFGSAEEGAKAFDKMAKFASKVPFSLQEIQAGSGNLAVVAKDAEELSDLLEITGNVAAATGLDFRTTAEQIQRSFSAGIGAADLFRDRGVRAMLGFKAGATVSINETIKRFDEVFGEGGEFGGTTDALAQTLEGTLSMIGDKVFNFKKTLLDAGFFSELKRQFGDLDKFLEKNAETLDRVAVEIGTKLAQAVVATAEGMKTLADNMETVKIVAAGLLLAIAPIPTSLGLIALAIKKVSDESAILRREMFDVKDSFEGLNVFQLNKQLETLEDRFKALQELSPLEKKGKGASFSKELFTISEAIDEIKAKIASLQALEVKLFPKLPEQVKKDTLTVEQELEKQLKAYRQYANIRRYQAAEQAREQAKINKMGLDEIHNNTRDSLQAISGLNRTAFEAYKRFQIAEATINAVRAASKAFGQYPFPLNLAVSASALAKGLALVAQIKSTNFRAGGGSVNKGQPYMVGEKGPEMFVPSGSGKIVANNQMGNGQPVNVNFNINTVDARGFNELLTNSRGVIVNMINSAVNETGRQAIV